jgi:hypothetical protein
MWVDDQPTKAYQITQLALILFVAHMTASCLIFSILLMLSDAGGGALCCIGSHLVVTGIAVAVKLLLLRK